MANTNSNLKNTILSNNIKYLRKKHKFSQETLAEKLGINRSNIAAYESKNVEPRLKIILEIAKLFNVSVQTLIEKKIENDADIDAPGAIGPADVNINTGALDLRNQEKLVDFIKKSERIRKVLEGFKSFYKFKKDQLSATSEHDKKLHFDIENFLQLMEHLLNYNESVIKTVQNIQAQGITKSEPA